MDLITFKRHIEHKPNTEFKYGISKPFSWRGAYDEVAFQIIDAPMKKEDVLKNIELAYSQTFVGYKGGVYRYSDWTPVRFEEGNGNYSDGKYTANIISQIEGGNIYESQEHRLVCLAFT